MIISAIEIQNFRSIKSARIELKQLTMFVGQNDVGKSNVLKAINLFFNNETDRDKYFNFDTDYSKFAVKLKKKAEEIKITLFIDPPPNYHSSQQIRWTKIYRKNGLHHNNVKFADGSEFPPRSKLFAWLENIRYTYVPAIKDSLFFELLLEKLHDSLADTIESELINAGKNFTDAIKENSLELLGQLDSRLGMTSQIALPNNLQRLFRTLNFVSSDGGFDISLDNRGDGLKTRHIPVILKFIADQYNINKVKGSPNINMIWGYEEPENNLEIQTSFTFANQLFEYSNQIQILLTTHSPAFYGLKATFPDLIKLYGLKKLQLNSAEIHEVSNASDLDEEMGILPLIAPYIKKKIEEIEEQRRKILEYEALVDKDNKYVIFVEGKDEVRIFEKVILILELNDLIKVDCNGLGCTGVKNQIMAWSWVASLTKYKAFGIFDNDTSGSNEFNKIKEEEQYNRAVSSKAVKCVKLKTPTHLTRLKSIVNQFPIELEECYPNDVWKYAERSSYLEPRTISELSSFVNVDDISQSISDKLDALGLSPEELLYLKYKVKDNAKEKLSKYITKHSKHLEYFDNFLKEQIIPFFNLKNN